MLWKIAEARKRFSELLRLAGREPQTILFRDRRVAVVLDPETYDRLVAGKPRPSLWEATAEMRRICAEDGYELEVPPRHTRPNAFVELLDEISD